MSKLILTTNDIWAIKEIATKLWLETKNPSLISVHIKALENFLVSKGLDPQFKVSKLEES